MCLSFLFRLLLTMWAIELENIWKPDNAKC